jgi:hypothetical protein
MKIPVLLFLGVMKISFAQYPELDWSTLYDGPMQGHKVDYFQDMVVDDNENYYIISGTKGPASNFDFNITTIKINSEGIFQWANTYDGGGSNSGDHPRDILYDPSGFIISIGKLREAGIIAIKYNLTGQVQWTYISPNANDEAYSSAIDAEGNIYIAGYTRPLQNQAHFDAMIIKLNSGGTQQFRNFYRFGLALISPSASYRSYFTQMVWDNNGDLVTVGNFSRSGGGWICNFAAKYNKSGNELWRTLFLDDSLNTGAIYINASICVDASNNIYAAGSNVTDNIFYNNYQVARLDNSNGMVSWRQNINASSFGSGDDFVKSLQADNLGNVYLSGMSRKFANTNSFTVIKFNSSNGDTLWNKFLFDDSYCANTYNDFIIDESDNLLISTPVYIFSSYGCVRKYNPDGDTLWVKIVNNAFWGNQWDASWINAHLTTIIKKDNKIYFGSSGGTSISDTLDVCAAKILEGTTDLEQISSEIPESFQLYQNYPNPFNPSTKIRWQSPVSSWQSIKIYDVLGNEVSILFDEYKLAGSYEVEFDASKISSGIYFYKLQAFDPGTSSGKGFSETKKMILIK